MTGFSDMIVDHEPQPRPAVVKLPVRPAERRWLVHLDREAPGLTPAIYAHGDALDGYDIAWVVMERLPHGPLSEAWQGAEFDLIVEAITRFYEVADRTPTDGEPLRVDWDRVCKRSRDGVGKHGLPNGQRWKNVLKQVGRKLDQWSEAWETRPISGWRHGDLHLRNAMTRTEPPGGPAVLLDFAEIRPGHWLEDAVYLEYLFWQDRDRLGGRKLVSQIARRRRDLGLTVDEDWAALADVRRMLLAMSAPAMIQQEGGLAHLDAALQVLERQLGK